MSYYYEHPKWSRLDRHVRRMTINLIEGYETMEGRLNDLVFQTFGDDGQPKGSGKSDPTFQAVERLQSTPEYRAVSAIDEALTDIPEEYRKVVKEWTTSDLPLYAIEGSELASTTTWTKWRERFLEGTAIRMGWVEAEE